MTQEQQPRRVPMVRPFPMPGMLVTHAYHELDIAERGEVEYRGALGNLATLPRPWEPAGITHAGLRRQVWDWLEEVVTWLNTEYVWDVENMVPPCWPEHPHLVHELAVLADRRRRATLSYTSDALEEWHHYEHPAFIERVRSRTKAHCQGGHQAWPAHGRHVQHVLQHHGRERAYDADLATMAGGAD